MLGARTALVMVTTSLFALSACTTATPAVTTGPPSAPAASVATSPLDTLAPASVPASVSPSVEVPTIAPPSEAPPSEAPPTIGPAPEPTATPKPTKTPTPQPEGKPNLVITKLAVADDPVLLGTPTQLKATVKNTGSTAANPFNVVFLFAYADQSGMIESNFVNGLAAGGTKQLSVTFNPQVASEYTLTVRADPEDAVNEESESDNEKSINEKVLSLGNLKFAPNSFTVTLAASGKYSFKFTVTNTGTATLDGPLNVLMFAYTSAGEYVEWGNFATNITLAPGDNYTNDAEFTVAPNTYRAYALADSGEVFQEIDETDNEAYYDFTAP